MKNSVSDHGFYIESDEDNELGKEENDGNESDYSNDSDDNQGQRKPSSYSMAWPQSYRSINYCFVIVNCLSMKQCF